MKIIGIAEANASLSDSMIELAQEPIIVTRNGQSIGALISLTDLDMEALSLSPNSTNSSFIDLIDPSQSQWHSQGGISSADMRRRLGLDRV